MANYEMIGVKMGFDSTAVTTGTKKASKDVESFKQNAAQVNETIQKIGLGFIAPLAAIQKLSSAIIQFGKDSEFSVNSTERALYRLVTASDGLADSITSKVGQAVGGTFKKLEDYGNLFVFIGEKVGAVTDNTTKTKYEQEKLNEEASKYARLVKEAGGSWEKIVDYDKRLKEYAEQKRPLFEQMVRLKERDYDLSQQMDKLDKNSVEYAKVGAEYMENQYKIEVMRDKLLKEEADIAKEKKDSQEKTTKSVGEETKNRVELKKPLDDNKESSVEKAKADAKSADSTKKTKDNVEETKEPMSLVEQNAKRIADETKKWADNSESMLRNANGFVKMSVKRTGSAYENQDDYELSRTLNNVWREMQDVQAKNVGSSNPQWYQEAMLGPYKAEIDAIKSEMAARREQDRIENERAAWEKEHNVKVLTYEEKQSALLENIEKQLIESNRRWEVNGFKTVRTYEG